MATIRGGPGDNRLSGGAPGDTIYGYGGRDVLSGNGGADKLYGGADGDVLYGGASEDYLFGEGGNDVLRGGAGSDQLFGGGGTDRFVFGSLAEDRIPGGGRYIDTIRDFDRTEGDVIDVRGIDANARADGNQAFDWIGAAGFTGRAGQLHYIILQGSTVVQGDVDGDRQPDFSIAVSGEQRLYAGDFLL